MTAVAAPFEILPLAQAPPDWVDAVAQMVFEQWPEDCADDGCGNWEALAARMRARALARVWVARCAETGALAGTVSVVDRDLLPERPRLGPWVASLVVAEAHRRRGLGARLVGAAVAAMAAEAVAEEERTLYLWTERRGVDYYKHMGWTPVEVVRRRRRSAAMPVVVMKRSPRAPA
jgi:GNAT superfamily N-acetyltransferase